MRPTTNESAFDPEVRTQKIVMWIVLQFADVLKLATRLLPAKQRPSYTDFIQYLQHMATFVILPRYVRAWGHPSVTLRAMVDTLIPALVLGTWVGYWHGLMNGLLILAVMLVVYFILIDFVMSCLMVGVDLYQGPREEFYKTLSVQASAYTMRAMVVLILAVLVLFALFVPAEKMTLLFILCVVLLLARLLYLLRMVYASSQEIVLLDEGRTVEEIPEHAALNEGLYDETLDEDFYDEDYE